MALLAAAAFASWSWLRPYAWNPDPAARCKVIGTQVRKDLAYYWVDTHLKTIPGQTHDLLKPVRLITPWLNPVHFDGPATLAGQVVPVRILAGHPNSLTGALAASHHAEPGERPAA